MAHFSDVRAGRIGGGKLKDTVRKTHILHLNRIGGKDDPAICKLAISEGTPIEKYGFTFLAYSSHNADIENVA